ncbi:hypothetical protein BKA93DRAFT_927880 [Sparassis latifolia]
MPRSRKTFNHRENSTTHGAHTSRPTNPAIATPLAKNNCENKVWQQEDNDQDVDRRYREFADCSESFMIGAMPVDQFLEFLPRTDMSAMPPAAKAFKDVPAEADHRQQIIEPLIIALNCAGRGAVKSRPRCPGFVFVDTTSFGVNRGEIGSMTPHVSCFSEEVIDMANLKSTVTSSLAYADLYIEVQQHPGLDPFSDPAPGDGRPSHHFFLITDNEGIRERAEQGLGRNVACVTEACARQHRSCYFSVALSGSRVRLIRWDRAGAIASESVDLHNNARPICEFLWRYAHASQSQRGHDPTVQSVTKEEEKLFSESIKRHVESQLGFSDQTSLIAAMAEHYKPGTVVAVAMVNNSSEERRLLVSRPVVSPVSMMGRGTRGYWAVDAGSPTGAVFFLKDTWRCNNECQTEGEILADLHRAGVPNIPQLICHGDVLERQPQLNINKIKVKENGCVESGQAHWVCKRERDQTLYECNRAPFECDQAPLRPLVHYRLVSGTVGYGLQHFQGTQELLCGTFDAYQAIMGAMNVEDPAKRRVHRNVSLQNIILFRDPNAVGMIRRGYLIDWSLSCLVTAEGRARDPANVGTFQFMSQRSLSWKEEAQTIQDDMESLLWVVLYCSLLWLDHDLPPQALSKVVADIFDQLVIRFGEVMAGEGKIFNQLDRRYTSKIHFSNPTMQQWLDAAMDFNARMWDPAKFNAFWQDFLDTHEISNNDSLTNINSCSSLPFAFVYFIYFVYYVVRVRDYPRQSHLTSVNAISCP